MKIRDRLKPDAPVSIFNGEGGISILASNGHPLWNIRLKDDGSLVIHGGTTNEHNGKMHNEWITITPIASNEILIKHHEMVFPASK